MRCVQTVGKLPGVLVRHNPKGMQSRRNIIFRSCNSLPLVTVSFSFSVNSSGGNPCPVTAHFPVMCSRCRPSPFKSPMCSFTSSTTFFSSLSLAGIWSAVLGLGHVGPSRCACVVRRLPTMLPHGCGSLLKSAWVTDLGYGFSLTGSLPMTRSK